ncbi:MAG: hypothetical protein EOO73_04810 [Myxococcales bacterium]|nr:MAG: hypothetical protein EOO73_04810 [Myxococcales bacterium]
MSNDDLLVNYLAGWHRSLSRMQRAYPARWHVPGLSDEEVRDTLTLQLLEVVRDDPQSALPDRPTALRIMRRRLATLRKSFRLGATPTDFDEAPPRMAQAGDEARYLEREADACRAEAAAAVRTRLSVPQRRWLAAFTLAANGGAFFEASDEPNLSAASRVLGRHRSSALRAYQELQTEFQRERRRIEHDE